MWQRVTGGDDPGTRLCWDSRFPAGDGSGGTRLVES
jgi:hypothetical protein